MKHNIEWSKLLLVTLIALFLFSIGLLLGYIISNYSKSDTKIIEEGIYNDLLEIQLQKELLNQYPCSEQLLNSLSDRLNYIGNVVELLEKRFGLNNDQVKNIKKLYIILQINHYLIEQQRNQECSQEKDIILFFYSNDKEDEKGLEIGSILQYVRSNNDESRVYSIDTSIKLDSTKILMKEYNVSSVPKVVVNGIPISNIQTSKDVTKYF